MKLAALGGHPAHVSADAARFMRRASLRRGFGFTERELDTLPARTARWYEAFLQGLDDAAQEKASKTSR